jgi:hypothetical protein
MSSVLRSVRTRAARVAALCAASLALVIACAIERGAIGPVQGWYEGHGPVLPHDTFPADCTLCHTGDDWHTLREDFQFDHAATTGYQLEGAHAQAQCLRCHNDRGPVQLYAQRGCAGCHEDSHRGQLGAGCSDCHDQRTWRPQGQVAKHMEYGFPLVGAHASAACWRCHPDAQVGNFARAPSDCVACHRDDLASALEPNHQTQGWVQDCQECHIPTSWSGAGFNHPWPLTGAHSQAQCAECHTGGIFAGTPDQCADCHLDDYQAATNPNHAALGLPTSCQQCHDTSSWQSATMSHAGITSSCSACHLDDYQATTEPNHAAAGFPVSCEECHGTNAWTPANFDHAFPIQSGDHGGLDCTDCHLQPSNFLVFSCTHCHEHNKKEMDDKHDRVGGYVWSSPACYDCHPNGQE